MVTVALPNRTPRPTSLASGFTLLEVLIAVFVLAIGVLGLAAMQLASKQSGAEASQRTIAAHLAFDLLERMRLNARGTPSPLETYVSQGASLSSLDQFDAAVDCAAASCTPAELAVFDLGSVFSAALGAQEQRATALVGGLNAPTLCVSGPNNGGAGTYRVTIAWRGKAALTDGNAGNECGSGRTTEAEYGAGLKYRRILDVTTYIGNA